MSEETGQFIMRALTRTFTIAALVLLFTFAANAQTGSRTTRIYRPCGSQPLSVSPRTPAQVTLDSSGNIVLNPCYQTSIKFIDPHNGPTTGFTWSSLTGFQFNGDLHLAGGFVYDASSTIGLDRTITAAGTTGARTINKMAGTVNFAAAATSIVVTNNQVNTSSLIFTTIRTADATCTFVKSTVAASGSFTITLNAGCTAETSVGFWVTN